MWRTAWQKALVRAEKVVGYPTTLFNLRYLLSDELSNVAGHMQKLVGTKHPLLQTVRGLVGNRKSMAQTRGLLVLLLARSCSDLRSTSAMTRDSQQLHAGILPGQRSLAEIAETVHSAMTIHRGVVDLDKYEVGSALRHDLEFGNKMATLSGDFLLASVSTALADLHNTHIVEYVSEGIGYMVEAEFSLLASTPAPPNSFSQSGPLLVPSCGTPLNQVHWEDYVQLSRGFILGRCASSAALLADVGSDIRIAIERFSRDWSNLYQLTEEIRALRTNTWSADRPCLPHILAANSGVSDWKEPAEMALLVYVQSAHTSLKSLPKTEATDVLGQMVSAVSKEI